MSAATSRREPRCFALLPCAGTGARAGTVVPKQYQPMAGQPMVAHTLAAFAQVRRIERVLVVVAPGDDFWREDSLATRRGEGAGVRGALPQAASDARRVRSADSRHNLRWPARAGDDAASQRLAPADGQAVLIADCGGATRAESVFNGLDALLRSGAKTTDWVLVHDAARCLVTPALIDTLIDACLLDAVGGLLALPLADTLKRAGADGRAAATIDRADKWLAQTPQMFRIGLLRDALAAHAASGFAGITDEASAIEAAGHAPLLVPGSAQNFKVTYPEDFALAEAVLRARGANPTQDIP